MKSLEQSISESLDSNQLEIYPYLNYILQDLWEMGSDPDILIDIIKKYYHSDQKIKVLDLACGKGAVSIKIAQELAFHCTGIDGEASFIETAKSKAKQFHVEHLCHFIQADIRTTIHQMDQYDLIILGSIGPILGNYTESLDILSDHLHDHGLIIIDEGYLAHNNEPSSSPMITKNELILQVNESKMKLINEFIIPSDDSTEEDYDHELSSIIRRCEELKLQFPDKSNLFDQYICNQRSEYKNLMNNFVCSTMIFAKNQI